MIKFSIQFATLLFMILFFTQCVSNDVMIRALEGENADFSNFKTYYVLPDPPMADDPNFHVRSYPRQIVEQSIRKELNNRNYSETKNQADADMLVAIQFSIKDEERTRLSLIHI